MKLRIAHVIRSVDPRSGGPIEGIIRQNEAVKDRCAREIVSLDPPDAPFLAACPVQTHALGVTSYKKTIKSRLELFGYTPHLVPWLRSHANAYDCVVVNGLWNYASVGASRVLPKQETPYFVFTHGMLDPWFRKTSPRKHHLKQLFWTMFEGHLLSGAQSVFFTTEEERRLAEGVFWGHGYRSEVVGYGTADVPTDEQAQAEAFRVALPALAGRPYLLFLSRIHPKKGCDLLISAFGSIQATNPDLDLVIAGPDNDQMGFKLKSMALAGGFANRLHWPGMLEGAAKWGAFRGAQAFVLPSHQENFGIVVAEALACGTPVLITDKVNIWREAAAAQAALVGADNQAGVHDLLQRWLALSDEARAAMRLAARRCFLEHFDVKRSAVHLTDRLEIMIEAARRG